MFTETGRRPTTSLQYLLVALCVPVWLALASHTPVLETMPGAVVLIVFIVCAFTLARGPAVFAVAIGVVGHELIRSAGPALLHVQRMGAVSAIGAITIALASARTTRYVAAQRYQVLFERHPLPMLVFDDETLSVLSVNRACLATYGYTESEFRRMTLRDLRTEDEFDALLKKPWLASSDVTVVTKHRTKDAKVLDVQVRYQAVPFQGHAARLALIENITEQRALEAQLRHSQKMEAVGQLAGGIAHDFNNLLTAIRGYASLLLDGLPDGDPRREDVIEIERAGERATALTRQLLAFSRKQILQERVLSINEVVDELSPMLRRLVGEDIELRTLTRSRGYVKADPSQLEQVVVNLVVNARDALTARGEITIETADIIIDDLYVRSHPHARLGPHVVLIVSDNGHGMTQEVQGRAFEPFFTTKPAGQGTGLGLSTVYGIVKQSGGHIWIYSEEGRGTTIKVYLPRTDEVADDATSLSTANRTSAVNRATVLLVEDEESVRMLLQKVLTRAGYDVHVAAKPADVYDLLQRGEPRFDLLITDVVLAQQGGREVAETVQKTQPQCRVLFISGYTDDAVVRYGILTEQMPFLQKPFSAAALLDRVASILAPNTY